MIRRHCCAKCGAYCIRRTAARRGAEPARRVGTYGHHALRPWPALFAQPDQSAPARSLVHAGRRGVKLCTCRRCREAGSCARRWRGNAPVRLCRRRLPAFTWWKQPSRSIARFPQRAREAQPGAGAGAGAGPVSGNLTFRHADIAVQGTAWLRLPTCRHPRFQTSRGLRRGWPGQRGHGDS